MGKYLMSISDMKKADSRELIDTMQKISSILTEREMNSPELDMNQVFRALLSDPVFHNPSSIAEPFVITNSLIAMPSVIPEKGKDGKSRGESVIPFVQIPGSEPYQAYREDSHTFVDSMSVNLRGGRSVSIHSVVPGMLVSFHHFSGEGGRRVRDRIDVLRISYDENSELIFESMPEEDALFPMPN